MLSGKGLRPAFVVGTRHLPSLERRHGCASINSLQKFLHKPSADGGFSHQRSHLAVTNALRLLFLPGDAAAHDEPCKETCFVAGALSCAGDASCDDAWQYVNAVCVCVCVCARARVCVCVCGDSALCEGFAVVSLAEGDVYRSARRGLWVALLDSARARRDWTDSVAHS